MPQTDQPQHCSPRAYDLFRACLGSVESTQGLLLAATAISLHQAPGGDPTQVLLDVRNLADTVRKRIGGESPMAAFSHLHEVLFGKEGFKGNEGDFFDPRNSYIPAVMERRVGIPISLCLVYKGVAERVGLSVEGIGAPGHFLARIQVGKESILVDPFAEGRVLSREEAFQTMERALGVEVPRSDEHLQATSHRRWLDRILRNLMIIFDKKDRGVDLSAMKELQVLVRGVRPPSSRAGPPV